jgi:hypothetical protein
VERVTTLSSGELTLCPFREVVSDEAAQPPGLDLAGRRGTRRRQSRNPQRADGNTAAGPLLFWGGPFRAETVWTEATPYDLAPTLGALLGVELKDAVGRDRMLVH